MAPVKKISGVPPPRFNLVSQVWALFHYDWSRFPILEGRPRTSFVIALLYEDPVSTQDATTLCCPLQLRASTYSTCPVRQWLVGCLVGVGSDLVLISFWTSFFSASLCRPSACFFVCFFDFTIYIYILSF